MQNKINSIEDRIYLSEMLYQEITKIQGKKWKPFWKTFSSFVALEKWKKQQKDPRLW